MKKRNILLAITAAALFSSCGLYSTYKRPEIKETKLYGDSLAAITDTSSLGQIGWRQLFTDPQLQKLIEAGLANNSDLRIAFLKANQASAYLSVSKLAYLPTLNLTPNGTISSYDGNKATKAYQLAAAASWEVDIFGKITNAKREAVAALEQSNAYKQAVQTQLISTIAKSYYALLAYDRQLVITQQTLSNWNEYLRTIRALKEAGQATEAAVAQSQSNVIAVQSQELALKQQISTLENSLCTLLAEPPHHIARGSIEGQQFPDTIATGVALAELSKRPDVMQAEALLKQAFYATNQARSAFYPSIKLSGTAGWTNNLGGMISNPGGWMLQAMGSLTQPILNSGANRANLSVAKDQQEIALINFQQNLLSAGAEVNSALIQWQTARERLKLDQQQVETLQLAVKSTQLLMANSSNTSYLEVITAQQSLLQAQLSMIANKLNEIEGVVTLYHSLGGGTK